MLRMKMGMREVLNHKSYKIIQIMAAVEVFSPYFIKDLSYINAEKYTRKGFYYLWENLLQKSE